jgi:hypothetical protein
MGCTPKATHDLKYPSGIIDALESGDTEGASVGAVKFDLYDWSKGDATFDRSIYLYMPLTLENQSQANWDHTDIGHTGAAFSNAMQGGSSMSSAMASALNMNLSDLSGQVSSGINTLANNIAGIGSDQIDSMMADSSSFAGAKMRQIINARDSSGKAEAMFQNVTKQVLNPYMSLTFRGVNFRTFSFEFHFTPKSEKESEEIYEIIKEFKKAQHPETQGSFFQSYPKEIQITYIHSLSQGNSKDFRDRSGKESKMKAGENKWLNKFKKCVLNDVSVNYTSAGFYAPMRNGFPAQTSLHLSFTENELLNRCDIEEGY